LGFHKSNILYIRNDIKIHAGPTEAKNFKSQLEKKKQPTKLEKRKSPKSNESNSKPEEGEP
jgi:hypothetical protein